MPKATLEFNLPEENDEHLLAVNASNMYSVLWSFDQWLRSEIKHNNKDYQDIRDKLHEFINYSGFDLDMVS